MSALASSDDAHTLLGSARGDASHVGAALRFAQSAYGVGVTTHLHAALGLAGDELTFDLVLEACDRRLPETEQLDFKRVLPLPVDQSSDEREVRARALELAKDVAAMANSRGGMLIYGVRDEENRAAEVTGVEDLSDGEMARRIRQVAFNLVYPPAQTTCIPLSSGDQRVLVVEVPESSDAPHLVQPRRDGGNGGWFMAPYRSGPDTQNMVEKQLESAYRERIDGRRRSRQDLLEALEELTARRVPPSEERTGTVVAIARPMQARRGPLPGERPEHTALSIVQSAAALSSHLAGQRVLNTEAFAATLLSRADRPRRSLRRFAFTSAWQRHQADHPRGRPAEVSAEIHDDGALGFTWRRGGAFEYARDEDDAPPTPCLGERDMDMVCITLLSLVMAAHEELGVGPDFQMRVAIVPNDALAIVPDAGWRPDSLTVAPTPPPVESEVRLGAGPDIRAADMLAFAHDLNSMVEQSWTAFENFWSLPLRTTSPHPLLEVAERLFGGEPVHPVTGKTMR